jgi:DNA-binding MarR family transcriptional regulator
MTPEADAADRPTLLFELYVANQAARRFMRLVLDGAPLSSEEFVLLSYLQANGARMQSQAARDLGLPVTSLATTVAPLVESGLVDRTAHPRDRRAHLLDLTELGRRDLADALPTFNEAYASLLERLVEGGADIEATSGGIAAMRSEIERSCDLIEDRRARDRVARARA